MEKRDYMVYETRYYRIYGPFGTNVKIRRHKIGLINSESNFVKELFQSQRNWRCPLNNRLYVVKGYTSESSLGWYDIEVRQLDEKTHKPIECHGERDVRDG